MPDPPQPVQPRDLLLSPCSGEVPAHARRVHRRVRRQVHGQTLLMQRAPVTDETLSLRECADRLGVHYMTAYKYVRHGRLAATKVGPEWRGLSGDLEAFLAGPASGPAPWADPLQAPLLARG